MWHSHERSWPKKAWPGLELIAASPQTPFHECESAGLSREAMIHMIAGDPQRIKICPERRQETPDDVWQAYEKLAKRGYSKRPVRG